MDIRAVDAQEDHCKIDFHPMEEDQAAGDSNEVTAAPETHPSRGDGEDVVMTLCSETPVLAALPALRAGSFFWRITKRSSEGCAHCIIP